jgi:DNA-directed RNA polymerase subunit F
MNVLNEEVITDAEAKEVLKQREKEAELKFEQKNSLELLNKFAEFSEEKVKKLVEGLKTMPRLRDKQIVAIANFLPEDREEMRVVLHKEYTNFTPEEIDQILETVKKHI